MAAEEQILGDTEVQTKRTCVVEFLHGEQMAPTDTYQQLLDVSGDQTVDISTVRQWMAYQHFSSGDADRFWCRV